MKINIIYSSSNEFARYAYISMWSLFKTNLNVDEIYVYLIEEGISYNNQIAFKELAKKYNRNIIIIPFIDLNNKLENAKSYYNSKATYAKLLASTFCKEDKIIYIDSDTIITKSLVNMWRIDIDNYLIAGVQDCLQDYYLDSVGMDVDDRYINGGILIFNLKKWREVALEKQFLDYITAHNGDLPNVDQGIINGVCKDQILILDPKYNTIPQVFFYKSSKSIKKIYNIKKYYTQQQIDDAISEPVIIHFIRSFYDRPWNKSCTHPYKKLYLEYLNNSCFDKTLGNPSLKKSVRIRKFVYEHMPFSAFYILEKMLDYRRKYIIKNRYLKKE